MPDLTLADLVRNRTLSPEMAATLATAAAERRSLLNVAIPRGSGKSTLMQAALAHAPAGTTLHRLSEAFGPGLGIPGAADGGYLVLAEISTAPMPDYLWGAPVRAIFAAAAERGFPLATALHAPGAREAWAVITDQNGVPAAQAAHLDLICYLRSLGDDWQHPLRRVLAELYELDGLAGGQPVLRLLHRWNEAADRFEAVEPPIRIGSGNQRLAEFTRRFQEYA